MTLTQDQYDKLLANYAESLVDGMDMDSLVQFAMEQIEENIRRNCSLDEELIEEIGRYYEETDFLRTRMLGLWVSMVWSF